MKKKVYNKLVRDRIPEILTNRGIIFSTHIADDEEYRKALYAKLLEEANEFIENPCPEEMADILEVLEFIRKDHNFTLEEIKVEKTRKRYSRSGFGEKVILEWTKE